MRFGLSIEAPRRRGSAPTTAILTFATLLAACSGDAGPPPAEDQRPAVVRCGSLGSTRLYVAEGTCAEARSLARQVRADRSLGASGYRCQRSIGELITETYCDQGQTRITLSQPEPAVAGRSCGTLTRADGARVRVRVLRGSCERAKRLGRMPFTARDQAPHAVAGARCKGALPGGGPGGDALYVYCRDPEVKVALTISGTAR